MKKVHNSDLDEVGLRLGDTGATRPMPPAASVRSVDGGAFCRRREPAGEGDDGCIGDDDVRPVDNTGPSAGLPESVADPSVRDADEECMPARCTATHTYTHTYTVIQPTLNGCTCGTGRCTHDTCPHRIQQRQRSRVIAY